MKTSSKVELAVDAIRLKLYDQTKDMTLTERREYYALTTIETVVGQKQRSTRQFGK